MSILDLIGGGDREKLVSTVEALTAAVQQQNTIIMTLVQKVKENREVLQTVVDELPEHRETIQQIMKEVPEHREAIGELGSISSFIIQQQNEISQHIMLTENIRKGKFLPGTIDLNTDDDLIN
ncbi:MAG: hypothetical protein ACW96N_04625 [Candidatus Thorarchaeota archaeon]|jgi:hypothetical protein